MSRLDQNHTGAMGHDEATGSNGLPVAGGPTREGESSELSARTIPRLDETLDLDEIISIATALVVPALGDWCALDLIEPDGTVRRASVAGIESVPLASLERLRELPTDLGSRGAGARAIDRRRPVVVRHLTGRALDGHRRGSEAVAAILGLGSTSAMALPLVARGAILGVLLVGGTNGARRFGDAQARRGMEVASRIALGVSNARLYAAGQATRHAAEEREARLAQLAASEHGRAAELNAIIRAIGDGILVCDHAGRIRLANPAARSLLPPLDEWTYAALVERFDDLDGRAPTLGAPSEPVELQLRDGPNRWIEISAYPVDPESQAPEGETIIVLRDVTAARGQRAVRDAFVDMLSHELRTPVTTIYAGAKVLARGSASLSEEARRGIFEDLHAEAERLHRLVEDVVALTRFGDGSSEIGNEPVLLQRVLPTVARSEQGRWPGVSFRLDLPPDLPPVAADATYIEQVARNLLANAAKYGPRGSTVEVVAEAGADEVMVRVLDEGPGFPADEASRLFELYYRSPLTASKAAGAGIGLFVCARLVQAMQGRIWALPRPTGGAEFAFALRIMDEAD